MITAVKLAFPHIKHVDFITRLVNFSLSVEKLLNNAVNMPGPHWFGFYLGRNFVLGS